MAHPVSDPTHTATADAPVEDPTTGARPPQLEYVAPADPPASDPHPVTPATEDANRPLTRKELEEWYASKNSPATTPAVTAKPADKPAPAKAASPAPKAPDSSTSTPASGGEATPKSSAWFKGRPDKAK